MTAVRFVGLLLAVGLVVASCSDDATPTDPAARAVTIHTTSCGHASGTSGSGVIVDRKTVLTAAHVVVGATEVVIGEDRKPAIVVALDPTRDLAVLTSESVDASPVDLVELANGAEARIVGGSSSGDLEATVVRRAVMDVDDVRASTRSTRIGYELDAAITGGDSGAGVYDADGRLAAIVFAVPSERDGATYAVGRTEIESVLVADRRSFRCDPERSQLTPIP